MDKNLTGLLGSKFPGSTKQEDEQISLVAMASDTGNTINSMMDLVSINYGNYPHRPANRPWPLFMHAINALQKCFKC